MHVTLSAIYAILGCVYLVRSASAFRIQMYISQFYRTNWDVFLMASLRALSNSNMYNEIQFEKKEKNKSKIWFLAVTFIRITSVPNSDD